MPGTSWNPADKTTGLTLTNSNLTCTVSTLMSPNGVRSLDWIAGAKIYFECTWGTISSTEGIGIATPSAVLTSASWAQTSFVTNAGALYVNGATTGQNIGAFSSGNVVCIAADLTASLIWFRRGAAGPWNNNASYDPGAGTGGQSITAAGFGAAVHTFAYLAYNSSAVGAAITSNFGDTTFAGVVPTGFTAGFPGTALGAARAFAVVMA